MTRKEAITVLEKDREACQEAMDTDFNAAAPLEVARNLAIQALKDIGDFRNELCLKCGNYQNAHKGACNGCRWDDYEGWLV